MLFVLQSCTEMVMPTCSDGITDMFESDPWNLTQLTAECRKKWNVVPRPRWIVEQYGGKNISTASNIIFRFDDCSQWIYFIVILDSFFVFQARSVLSQSILQCSLCSEIHMRSFCLQCHTSRCIFYLAHILFVCCIYLIFLLSRISPAVLSCLHMILI